MARLSGLFDYGNFSKGQGTIDAPNRFGLSKRIHAQELFSRSPDIGVLWQ